MLFKETTLSGFAVKNRIIRSATHDGLADENGAPGAELIAKYERLAKSEIGCIITGYAAVSKNGVSPYPRMLKIYDDSVIGEYKKLTDAVHRNGAPVVLQIAHCGRQTSSKAIGMPKVAPSNVLHAFYPDKAKVLEHSEIIGIIDDFVMAAVRAEKAGFDAVQLHAGHGYLLHDFLSPYGNRRKDSWGGSLENRCRVVELIIKGIKEKTNLPVWIKLSAEDNRKGGMDIDSSVKICKRLEAAGGDAIEVSCGTVQEGNLYFADSRFGNIYWNFNEGMFLTCAAELDLFFADVREYLCSYFSDNELFEDLFNYQKEMVALPSKKEKEIETLYDWHKYFSLIFDNSVTIPERKSTRLKLQPSATDNWIDYAREVVWYGRRNGKSLNKAEYV